MEVDMFVCFNDKQVHFIRWLAKMKLIKPIEASGIIHPLTGRTEIMVQKYTSNKVLSAIFQWIFKHLMDEEGNNRLQRMKDCGALKPATVSKEEAERNGAMYIRF